MPWNFGRVLARQRYFFREDDRHVLCLSDLDREQMSVFDYISLYGVKSDGINRYVHFILERKIKNDQKRAS